jgi:hypothetical protein
MYKKVLKKYETMEKGSRQRKMKFNPESVSEKERSMVQEWTSPAGTIAEEKDKRQLREGIPKMNPNALKRGLFKIHKDTQVKKHPKTGELMYLLHRGMDDEEHGKLSGNKFLKDYTSSWTPDFKEASTMGYNNTVSAWIPESQIKSIPNAIGQKDKGTDFKMGPADYRSEKEIIVQPHQLVTSNMKPMAASEKTISYEDAKEILRDFVLAKTQECDTIQEMELLEKNLKNAFAKGLTILGMIHGVNSMNPKTPAPKPKTQQQIQQEKQEIQNAYDQAKQEAQQIEAKYKDKSRNGNIDNFLKAIEMNESSGGKNTKHKEMKSGIHAGTSAYGNYGLMPNTIREMANRMDKDHPMKMYAGMENDQITESMKKNPDHQGKVARFLAEHLYDKFGGDENKMSYSYFNGHNLTNDHFKTSHKDYMDHPYVKKYQKHRAGFDKPQPKLQPQTDTNNNVASN